MSRQRSLISNVLGLFEKYMEVIDGTVNVNVKVDKKDLNSFLFAEKSIVKVISM